MHANFDGSNVRLSQVFPESRFVTLPSWVHPLILALLCLFGLQLLSKRSFASELERDLSQLFMNRSFTLRNFYQGSKLIYDRSGTLTSKSKAGYWSRDGMVVISSVKLGSDGVLVLRGERQTVEFDPAAGEFSNVRTGDHVQILVQLEANQMSFDAATLVLQKVFVTSREKLKDIAPSYWTNCLSQKVTRSSNSDLWECEPGNRAVVPDLAGKQIDWEAAPQDNSLHNGMKLYSLDHRIGYIREAGVSPAKVQVAPDPFLQWAQRRVRLGQLTCVLSFVIGEDGRVRDVNIVTPIGMGFDDEAATALKEWRFSPGRRGGATVPTFGRVVFMVTAPETQPTIPIIRSAH